MYMPRVGHEQFKDFMDMLSSLFYGRGVAQGIQSATHC